MAVPVGAHQLTGATRIALAHVDAKKLPSRPEAGANFFQGAPD